MIKVYISGQITGLNRDEAFKNFCDAELFLKDAGLEPVNPMKVCEFNPDWEWHHYMAKDIAALFECQAIFLLPNWEKSKGARIELRIAAELGLHIFTEAAAKGRSFLLVNEVRHPMEVFEIESLFDKNEIAGYIQIGGETDGQI